MTEPKSSCAYRGNRGGEIDHKAKCPRPIALFQWAPVRSIRGFAYRPHCESFAPREARMRRGDEHRLLAVCIHCSRHGRLPAGAGRFASAGHNDQSSACRDAATWETRTYACILSREAEAAANVRMYSENRQICRTGQKCSKPARNAPKTARNAPTARNAQAGLGVT